MSDLRELLGDDDYEATIDKAVQTAERYFDTANYTHPREGVGRCEYGCGVELIERTIEHVTARILHAALPGLLAQAWDEGAAAAWERSTAAVNAERYHWRSAGEPLNPYRQESGRG